MGEKISEKICRFTLIIVILLAVQSGSASDYPDFVGYVNDYAHLLSAPQASALNQELRDFDNRTTIEVAVVTVNSIGSENPQDYAVNLANYWGVGKRDKNNGIIFLVAMQSHDIWIEVGSGLSGQFSDSQVQQIVDNVIIPQFRTDRPDLGVINGVHSIISHFGDSSTPKNGPISSTFHDSTSQDSTSQDRERKTAVVLLVLFGILSVFGVTRWSQAKKNNEKIIDLKKLLNDLVDREAASLEALKDLKANYVQSIWQSAEEAFSRVDHESLELELLNAERTSRSGMIKAGAARSQIDVLENKFKVAQENIEVPISRLAEAKRAQQECAAILAGLDAAFLQAEKESVAGEISMATRLNLEVARHNHQEALSQSKQSMNEVDWITLYSRQLKILEDVEQVSKDAVRDRAIAEKIAGQDPDELMAKMEKTLSEAEKDLGKSSVAQEDLQAARAEYERTHEYSSGRMNTIDLYLIMTRINSNIEQGHQHHMDAVEKVRQMAEARAREKATAVHHNGFGSSGSRSLGGGRMGGGSHGGGSHGGGKW
jgi:uncharacterized membrane protein YgcG